MATASLSSFNPFVYWSQDPDHVNLKVDIKNAENPDIKFGEKEVSVIADGYGASGQNTYSMRLSLHSPIDPEECSFHILDRQITVKLKKRRTEFPKNAWPRLVAENGRSPQWLKIDFDRWVSTDDSDSEKEKPDLDAELLRQFASETKEVELTSKNDDDDDMGIKATYLFAYNLLQFIGFSAVFSTLMISYFREGPDARANGYKHTAHILMMCQLAAFLEVFNAFFGLVKGSAVTSLMQVSGRAFMLFLVIRNNPEIQKSDCVFYLFCVWTSVEVIRYPYYMLELFQREIGFLTWLRYSAWIVLYPAGFVLEGRIAFRMDSGVARGTAQGGPLVTPFPVGMCWVVIAIPDGKSRLRPCSMDMRSVELSHPNETEFYARHVGILFDHRVSMTSIRAQRNAVDNDTSDLRFLFLRFGASGDDNASSRKARHVVSACAERCLIKEVIAS